MKTAEAKTFAAVQTVWEQTSINYDAVERTRVMSLTPETTVAEVMAWAKVPALGRGDVRLIVQEDLGK